MMVENTAGILNSFGVSRREPPNAPLHPGAAPGALKRTVITGRDCFPRGRDHRDHAAREAAGHGGCQRDLPLALEPRALARVSSLLWATEINETAPKFDGAGANLSTFAMVSLFSWPEPGGSAAPY
jgi:hypothetical protein